MYGSARNTALRLMEVDKTRDQSQHIPSSSAEHHEENMSGAKAVFARALAGDADAQLVLSKVCAN